MSNRDCTFPGDREAALIAYLYDDITAGERAEFDAHLETCRLCTTELAAFGTLRGRLAQWAPPEPEWSHHPLTEPAAAPARATFAALPGWMQLAAAVLVLGVAMGAANLHIQYGSDGLTIRTGWMSPD